MNNWKKILIAIAVVLCLGLILEVASYLWQSNRLVKQGYRFANGATKPPYPTEIITFSKEYFENLDKDRIIKNVAGNQYKTSTIMVFGDVFVNSFDNSNNTFAHKLAKETKRPVYNMGECGWGIPHMYFLLKNEKELDKINPETIIFFYHSDMKNRLTSFSFYPHHSFLNLKYKLDDGTLIEDKPIIMGAYRSYALRNFERFIGWRKATSKYESIQEKNFDLIAKLFKESKELAQKKYPNLKKFIILRMPAPWETISKLEEYKETNKIAKAEYKRIKELQDEGYIVIDIPELTTSNIYKSENFSKDSSLKPEILDEIIPVIVKNEKLKTKEPVVKKKKRTIAKKVTQQTKEKKETVTTTKDKSTPNEIEITTKEKKKFWERFKRNKKTDIDK